MKVVDIIEEGKQEENETVVVLFCAQRQYKLYLSCIPCLIHVLHAMPWCLMPCLCAYLFPVIGSLASCSLLGGWGGSRPCEQVAASLAVLCFFFLFLLWCRAGRAWVKGISPCPSRHASGPCRLSGGWRCRCHRLGPRSVILQLLCWGHNQSRRPSQIGSCAHKKRLQRWKKAGQVQCNISFHAG